jgi:ribosomal protein S18 acetylase RimI-like enzyme
MKNPTITIRKASKKDLPIVLNMTCKLRDYHYRLDPVYKNGQLYRSYAKKYLLKDLKSKKSQILLAEGPDKKIIGFCLARIRPPFEEYRPKLVGFIYDIFLVPEYRRQRIGQALIAHQIFWFRKRRLGYVELYMDAQNRVGRGAWMKYGFRPILHKMRLGLQKIPSL